MRGGPEPGRLRLQDRRKRLIEIGRYLVKSGAVFSLRLEPQRDTDLVRIRQCLDDGRLGNQQCRLTLVIEFAARRLRHDQPRRPVELLLRECKCRLCLLECGNPRMQQAYLVCDILHG